MSYCTQADLTTRFGAAELLKATDRAAQGDPAPTEPDAAVIAAAIADASAEIDIALASCGVATPLSSPHAIIVAICCDLARARLYDDVSDDDTRQHPAHAAAKKASSLLDKIATGVLRVPGLATSDVIEVTSGESLMSRSSLTGW